MTSEGPRESAFESLVLSRAAQLARAGAYAEAEALVAGLGASAPSVLRLDLLARIRAQQGRLAEASVLWQQVLSLDPPNAAASRALSRVTAMQRQQFWPHRLARAVVVAGVATIAVALILTARRDMAAFQAAVRDDLRVATESREPAPPAPVVVAPAIALDIAGVRSETLGDAVAITFDEPVFERGTRFGATAKQRLAALGRQLRPHQGSLSITVFGLSDDSPITRGGPFQDNQALELARAAAAAAVIRGSDDLPAAMFTARSGRGAFGPDRAANIRSIWIMVRHTPREGTP